MAWQQFIPAGISAVSKLANLFGGSDKLDLEHPSQTAGTQRDWNRTAAEDTARFSNVNVETPWGKSTWTGRPGTSDRLHTIELNPYDQSTLDEQRMAQNRLTQFANTYLLPQVEDSFRNPLDFSSLPELYSGRGEISAPAIRNLTDLFSDMPINVNPGIQPGGMADRPSLPSNYVNFRPEAERTAYEDQLGEERAAREAANQAQYEAEFVLPDEIPLSVLSDFYSERAGGKGGKERDLKRWLRDNDLGGQTTFTPEELEAAARAGFSGASERSRQLLGKIPQYVEQWRDDNKVKQLAELLA